MSYRPKHAAFAAHLSLGAALVTLAGWACPATPAFAATLMTYDIAPGSLNSVLARFATDSGIYLIGLSDITQQQRSPGLHGRFEPDAALTMLLAGSGLQAQRLADNQYRLQPTAPASALELGATQVNAVLTNSTTEGSGSYTTGAITLGKGEHSLKETPQSVSVITRKQMDDQNLNTIDQVMEKTPGITVSGSPMAGKYFYSRGFKMDAPYQYDGVPLDVGSNYVQANNFSGEMAFYDHLEILRGAAGMMQGSGTPAGAVNLVRKRGQDKATTSVTLSAGTWDNYRQQVDTGGPLNDEGTLRGRAVVAHQDRQFFYDYGKREDDIAYGALDYDLSPNTTVGVGLAYEKLDATPCWGGLPRYADGGDLKLPRSTCLGASWNTWKSERTTVFADVTHHLNENWKLKLSSIYTHNDQNIKYGWGAGGGSVASGSTTSALTTRAGLLDYDQTDYGLDGFLDGTFEAFGLEHELTVGANASRSDYDDLFTYAALPGTADVFGYSGLSQPSNEYLIEHSYLGGWPYHAKTKIKQQGAYANLRLKLAEPLTVVLGGRVSDYRYENTSAAYGTPSTTLQKENGEFTPFGAVLLDLTPNLTLFASYAQIFQPQSNLDAQGKVLQPKTGTSYELGIKGAWFNGGLNATADLFRAYQEHSAAALPASACQASSSCSADTGKVRAQGVELEVSGSPLERLQVMAGYTYTQTLQLSAQRTVNLAASDGATYNTLVPRHLLRAWSEYELAGGLSDWSIGAGVTAQSDIYRVASTVKSSQAGYALWSARVKYRINENWSVALNGDNLLDKTYYQTIGDTQSANYYGEPRNFMVTLKGNF